MPPTCSEHGPLCTDIGEIKGIVGGIKDTVDKCFNKFEEHVTEANKQGGVRDRVLILERRMNLMPWISMASGFFGAILGQASPVAFDKFVGLLARHFGG